MAGAPLPPGKTTTATPGTIVGLGPLRYSYKESATGTGTAAAKGPFGGIATQPGGKMPVGGAGPFGAKPKPPRKPKWAFWR